MTRLLSLLLPAVTAIAAVGAAEIGKPHSTVIVLNGKNFDDHLNDSANGLWLLKFYAPWCGHCKQLAPVFEAVAPFLAGKMSLGTVDCTVEKKLCKRFNVKGYPTLKYYRDGDYQDYPLGRDKDSIIIFGEKMSDRAVKIVSSHDEAKTELLSKIPVAFIAYDPNVSTDNNSGEENASIDSSGATDDEKTTLKYIQSTERTRVFGQAARAMQAQGSFGLLSPETPVEELSKFFDGDADAAAPATYEGFIARIEDDVPIRLYEGALDTLAFMEFAKEQNLATLVELGGHNFRFVSRRGKRLAVAAYDPEEEVETAKFKKELKRYAIDGAHRDEYIFATMDGKKWEKFLSQFSITKENLPELFTIDVPGGVYWQDASVFGISEFIVAVQNGDIAMREQEKKKKGPLDELLQVFVDYMPWSLGVLFLLFITVFYLALPRMEDVQPIRPPLPKGEAAAAFTPCANEVSNGKETKKEDDSADEVSNKKDQ